jgi:hypothetical protein
MSSSSGFARFRFLYLATYVVLYLQFTKQIIASEIVKEANPLAQSHSMQAGL